MPDVVGVEMGVQAVNFAGVAGTAGIEKAYFAYIGVLVYCAPVLIGGIMFA